MNRRLLIRSEVPDDIRQINDYLGQYGTRGGRTFGEIVFATFDDLVAMPGQGSLKLFRNQRLQNVRSWSVRGFRKILIFYREMEDGIEILSVMHGARNVRSLLNRRLQNSP